MIYNVILLIGFLSWHTKAVKKSMLHHTSEISNTKFSWDNTGPKGGYFEKIIADPQDSNLAIAFGIITWITRDGQSWQVLRDGGLNTKAVFTGYHRLLLGIRDTLYYSSDGAVTFLPIRAGGYIEGLSDITSDTVYLIQDSSGISYLYRTMDGGLTWSKISPLSYTDYKYITFAPSDINTIYMAVKPNFNTDTVYIVGSNDGGVTWTILSQLGTDVDVKDISINPQDPQEAFVSCGFDGDFGLIYTDDGFSTLQSVQGVAIPYDVEYISSDTILVASVIPTGILKGIRTSHGWNFVKIDSLTTCTHISRSNNTFYVSALTGVLKSTDGGSSFVPVEQGLHATYTHEPRYLSKMIGRTVYMPSAQGNVIYITRNGGVTWEKVYIPDVAVIFDIEANPKDANIVYLAAGAGRVDSIGNLMLFNIFYSNDGGYNFIPLDTIRQNPDSFLWIETLHLFKDSSNIVLGMINIDSPDRDTMKILRSLDGGITFYDTSSGFTAYYDDFVGDNPVLFQADSVIYVSYDYGASFDTLKVLNHDMVMNLSYYENDSLLFFELYDYSDTVFSLRITDDSITSYYIPNIYLVYAAYNGGVYGLTSFPNLYFYTGTYKHPFDTMEQVNIPAGAIRASSNEVLLFSYGMGVFRSEDAVSGIPEHTKKTGILTFPVYANSVSLPFSLRFKKVDFYDITGRVVFSLNLKNNTLVSLKGIESGIYFVKVKGRGIIGKFIKIR